MKVDMTALFDLLPDLAEYCAMVDKADELRFKMHEAALEDKIEANNIYLELRYVQDRQMDTPIHAAYREWRERYWTKGQ